MTPSEGEGSTSDPDQPAPPDTHEHGDGDGWASWTASRKYDIERIVSARVAGRGWKIGVKWTGYPDITEENLSELLKSVSDGDILGQIEKCKQEYLARHPLRTVPDEDQPPAAQPERVQPARARDNPSRLMFMVNLTDDGIAQHFGSLRSLDLLQRDSTHRVSAIRQLMDDEW